MLRVLEIISKYIRTQPAISLYSLVFCRQVIEPLLLNIGLKLNSSVFIQNLKQIKSITGIKPKTILDIGAAIGKWSRAASYVFPDAKIYAFEPVPETFKLLRKNTTDIRKISVFNYALSNCNSISDFWLNDFRDSSSLLKMTDLRKKEQPQSRKAKIIKIACRRLDSIKEIEIDRPCYLKMDVEGAEMLVIEGMGKLIEKVDILHLECTFMNFFEGQTKYSDILLTAKKYGFVSFKEINTEYSIRNGSKVMSDLVFFKSEYLGATIL